MPNYRALIIDNQTNIQYVAEQLADNQQQATSELKIFYANALNTDTNIINVQSINEI